MYVSIPDLRQRPAKDGRNNVYILATNFDLELEMLSSESDAFVK